MKFEIEIVQYGIPYYRDEDEWYGDNVFTQEEMYSDDIVRTHIGVFTSYFTAHKMSQLLKEKIAKSNNYVVHTWTPQVIINKITGTKKEPLNEEQYYVAYFCVLTHKNKCMKWEHGDIDDFDINGCILTIEYTDTSKYFYFVDCNLEINWQHFD